MSKLLCCVFSVALVALLFSGCPGGSTAGPSLSVNPLSIRLNVGQTTSLTANSSASGDFFTWSSGDSAVATVDKEGGVSAVGPGTTRISVASDATGRVASASIMVAGADLAPQQVTISPGGATILLGDAVQLVASTTRPDGELTWVSADDSIATVNGDGLVSSAGVGTVAITARGSIAGEEATASITVVAAAIPAATVRPPGAGIYVGETLALSATSGDPSEDFAWVSQDAEIAAVDADGVVTAVAAGVVRVTATGLSTGSEGVTVVAVEEQEFIQVTVSPVAAIVAAGESVALSGSTTRIAGTLAWSSADESVATVDADGVVTGVSAGTIAITATGATDSERSSALVTVVEPVPVDAIVRPAGASIAIGDTVTLAASSGDIVEPFTWISADEGIATVDSAGVVTGTGAGTVSIAVTGENTGAVGSATLTVTEPMHQVLVAPAAATVVVADTVQLSALTSRAGDTFTWSSGDETIATVNGDGLVVAVGAGTAAITARGSRPEESSSAEITVVEPVVKAVAVRPLAASIAAGEQVALAATSTDVADEFTWSSGNEAAATVDASGVVTAVAPGTAAITVQGTISGASDVSTVTVTAAVVHQVLVMPGAAGIFVGDTLQLSGSTSRPGNVLTWSSDDTSVASVSASGLLTGAGAGTATITVEGTGPDERATAEITVMEIPVPVAMVRPLGASITAGSILALSATSPDSTDTFAWTSENPAIATVDVAGVVTGVTPGTVRILVEGLNSGATGNTTVTVAEAVVHRVQSSPPSATVFAGDTIQLTGTTTRAGDLLAWSSATPSVATVDPSGLVTGVDVGTSIISVQGTDPDERASSSITVVAPVVAEAMIRPLGATIEAGRTVSLAATSPVASDTFTWSTSDTSVAIVDTAGVVTGVSEGMATITATGSGSGARGSATIVVTPPTVTSVAVVPGMSTISVAGEVALTAVSTNAQDSFSWTSSNGTVASVNGSGLVRGVAPGTVTVRATGTASGTQGEATVTVVEDAEHEVSIAPVSPVIFVSETVALTATSTDTEEGFTWVSGNTGVATVSSSGVVTGRGPGTVVITAAGRDSGAGAGAMVTVNAHTVSVAPETAGILAGTTMALAATSTDSGDGFAWSSADQSIVTVNATGVVVGVRGGTTMVTATGTRSGQSDTSAITVRDGVAVNPPSGTVAEGRSLQLVAQSTDTTETFTWTTSNAGRATVSGTGQVTGVRAGNVTITATGNRSGESASATVRVVPVLSVTPASATVTLGRIVGLVAKITDVADVVTWTSSDPAVAAVNSSGVVTGVRVGSVRITAAGSHSGAVGFADVQVLPEFPNLVLFNGESAFNPATRSRRNTVEQFRGTGCLEGLPDQFAGFNTLVDDAAFRMDISRYDEIWMAVKAIGNGAHSAFSVRSFQGVSREVELASYAQGGIGSSYKLFRIPLADLVSDNFDFTSIENLSFGGAAADENFRLFIDEIWAVNLDSVSQSGGPLAGTLREFTFGNVDVMAGATANLSIRNIGASNLVVSDIFFEGPAGLAYDASPASFTLAPGATRAIAVDFSPDMAGNFDSTMVLAHNTTAFGRETRLPLKGNGVSARLALSRERVDFGQVPLAASIGQTVSLTNTGNAVLSVSAPTSSSGVFAVGSVGSFDVGPGATRALAITAAPVATGAVNGAVQFTTNDPGRTAVSIPLAVSGIAAASIGKLPLEVLDTTSSTVELNWGVLGPADQVRVTIGPEPSAVADGALPLEHEVAVLPGSAGGYTIGGLAAGVDVFVRVVASAVGVPIAERNIAVRTIGGPRVELDTPLREVHLFGPNIVQLVLADFRVHSFREDTDFPDSGIDEVIGFTGAKWQAGPWTVRRSNGAEIAVQAVHRHSIPVGARYYDVGYGAATRINLLDVDHMIYLKLAENVGNSEVLEITGPSFAYEILNPALVRENRSASLHVIVPFSDRYMVSTAIQVNQVGYSPAATRRYAYVSGWMGDGGPLDLGGYPATADVIVAAEDPLDRREAVLTGLPIRARSALDRDAGTAIKDIDIAALPASEDAVYHVRIPGVGISWPTKVSDTEVFRTYYHLARGMFHNRWAGDLAPEFTDWSRPQDHGSVFVSEGLEPFEFFAENTPLVGERPLVGGHHDAGDYDIRIYHSIVAQMLLRACELNEPAFGDGQLIIPESGNGIPDLLDEALWSVAGWEALQEDDGGVRIGAESYRHPFGVHLANEDPHPYWTYSRSPIFSARVAGIFAQASRLVAPYDAVRANVLRGRAEKAYAYAIDNGINEMNAGPLIYGASELFRLTGEERYREKVVSTWNSNLINGSTRLKLFDRDIPSVSTFSETRQPIVWDHVSGYLGSGDVEPGHMSDALVRLKATPGQILGVMETAHGHRNARPAEYPLTYGKGTAVGQYLYGVYAAMQYGQLDDETYQDAFDTLSLTADYTLGCNPAGMVWITGLGSRNPLEVLHLDSLSFLKFGQGQIPGIPVYGPADNLRQTVYYTFGARLAQPGYQESPPARRYGDVRTFVVASEFTVWECQAPMVQLFSLMVPPDMNPPEAWLPAAARNGGG